MLTREKITDDSGDVLEVRYLAPNDDLGLHLISGQANYSEGPNEWLFDQDAVRTLRDALDAYLEESYVLPETDDPEEAKLNLAVLFGLRAKFAYKGERDYRATERRLEPHEVKDLNGVKYVMGESFDDGGNSEGLRQFRLDRISGQVAIR